MNRLNSQVLYRNYEDVRRKENETFGTAESSLELRWYIVLLV